MMCLLLFAAGRAQDSSASPLQSAPAAEAAPETIFHHSQTARWWISGQDNVIFQAHGGFHSPYFGPNSLDSHGETATSNVVTLFTAFQFTPSFDVLFDLESAGGGGLSDALGLAGFTNLDVVRNPTLGAKPYVARILLHKVFALSKDTQDQQRNPVTSILTKLPVRRLELRIGKFGAADYFDLNSVGSDSHLQFLNWVADNNGSYDYAADTRGYTFGAIVEYQDRNWALRFGEMLMPKIANGPHLDADLARARAENIELELRPQLRKGRQTVVRLLTYINHADMGSYKEAIAAFRSGTDVQPTIEAHRKQGLSLIHI